MPLKGTAQEADLAGSRAQLESIVAHIAELLPGQGPISVFIHHNPLHSFEHLPFEEAVDLAGRIFGCKTFLAEERYRDELSCGRIHAADINAVLEAELGARAEETVIGGLTRHELWRRILVYGLPALSGQTLAWTLTETSALTTFRVDLPNSSRQSLGSEPASGEAQRVLALWHASKRAVRRCTPRTLKPPQPLIGHRELLQQVADVDVDEWINPVLIRVTSAYLDQGLADWAMPSRERGLLACFLELYQNRLARFCQPIGSELQPLVRDEFVAARDAWGSIEAALARLGIPRHEWESFLLAESLALRGFAGMVHQFESRPDRVPAFSLPARLVDFLAIRLLLLCAGLRHAAARVGFSGELGEFRIWLGQQLPAQELPTINDRAWPLFQLAQLAGLNAQSMDELDSAAIDSIEQEIVDLDGSARRRLLHLAYERHLRHRFFDALVAHPPSAQPTPHYQAMFCIDEREESIRRHLEEVDPEVETIGAAGFYGVAMYYRGATDATARPLCPVSIQPRHFVAEEDSGQPQGAGERMRERWDHISALVNKNIHLGGRRARRGALLFATVGVLWMLPVVLRAAFPWLARWVARMYSHLHAGGGRLVLEHSEVPPPAGEYSGFTTPEMADIVFSQLSPIGIRDRFAPLVLIFGHGSTSLNNPHESAHDCGACGGGRGGPNARAFAQMANNEAVRELVAERGLRIPPETWFVGGERNTANNDMGLFDTDLIPEHVRPLLSRAQASLEEARRREAHERCRRFESAALWLPAPAALFHVQARAVDLAQPRPEYGHATNAACFVGRRRRTRGLFLDRRAFLVSYDPDMDAEGNALATLLAAVVPVVAGINLEYFFGYVDPVGYGSGTKLPHNVTALIGVMDGAQSDLRTGLPWQMLEIHEPVRLSMVVEANVSVLQGLIEQNPYLKQLVDQRWLYLAALDPESNVLVEIDSTSLRAYTSQASPPASPGDSRPYYEGHRDHLPFATLNANQEGAPCAH